jgi:hypothetical protein
MAAANRLSRRRDDGHSAVTGVTKLLMRLSELLPGAAWIAARSEARSHHAEIPVTVCRSIIFPAASAYLVIANL